MMHNIVGYGSLISHKSLRETIPDKVFRPVFVKGYKRIFNLALENSKDPDVLNLIKSPKSVFNGVLFKANDKELLRIKEREAEYNIEEARAYDFYTNIALCKCLIAIDHVIAIDKHHNNPNKGYFILCREAAYHISKKFGEFWDKTTYLSNGENIEKWIKKNKQYDTI